MYFPNRQLVTKMVFSLSVFACVFIVGSVLFGVDGQKQVPFLAGEKGVDLIYEYATSNEEQQTRLTPFPD